MSWQPGDPLPEPGQLDKLTRRTAIALYAHDGHWPWWALAWRSLPWFARWQREGDQARKVYLAELEPIVRRNNELLAPHLLAHAEQTAARRLEQYDQRIARAGWG